MTFCVKYSALLQFTATQMDRLQEEFTEYQLLEMSEVLMKFGEKH